MALKRLSEVSIGSKIELHSRIYKVVENNDEVVLLQKEVVKGIFGEKTGAGAVISNYDGPESHLVNVVEEASGSKPSLTSQLKTQLNAGSQSSLTDSLRAQVTRGTVVSGNIGFATEKLKPVPAVDLKTSLQAQVAAQKADQAFKVGAEAKIAADSASKQASEVRSEVCAVKGEVRTVRNAIDAYNERQRQTERSQGNLEARIARVEQKQVEEENKVSLQEQFNKQLGLQKQFNESLKQQKTGGNNTMKKLLGNAFNFGKVEGKFAFSPITGGLALRKGISEDFIAYNKETKELTDVSGLTLKFNVPAFKLPVAAAQVVVGDIIIHNGEFVYVTKKADGYLEVINPEKGANASVIPTKNAILNATFYTVVKTLDAAGEGGFNPLLLMALDKGSDKKDLLPLLLMSGGLGNAGIPGAIDPTLLMLLGDDVDDLLPLVLMQQGGATGAGFNPLMFLLMGKGEKSKDLLPLLFATGGFSGAQAGAFNPMMLLAMGDGDIDPMTLMALSGGFGGQAGGIFGQAPAAAQAVNTDKKADK